MTAQHNPRQKHTKNTQTAVGRDRQHNRHN